MWNLLGGALKRQQQASLVRKPPSRRHPYQLYRKPPGTHARVTLQTPTADCARLSTCMCGGFGSVDARTGKAYDDMGWEVQQPEKDAARRPKTQATRPSKIKFAEVAWLSYETLTGAGSVSL